MQQRAGCLPLASLGSGCQLPTKKNPAQGHPGDSAFSVFPGAGRVDVKSSCLACSPGNSGAGFSQAGRWFGFSSVRKSLLIASSVWSDALTLPTSTGHSSHPVSGKVAPNTATANLFLFFLPAAQLLPTAAKNLPREPGGQGPVLALRPAHGDLQPSDHLRYQQPSEVPPQRSSVRPSSGPVFTSGLPPHPACPDQHQQPVPAPGLCSGQGCPSW